MKSEKNNNRKFNVEWLSPPGSAVEYKARQRGFKLDRKVPQNPDSTHSYNQSS